jgi:broad specificity phosphatase PhoE
MLNLLLTRHGNAAPDDVILGGTLDLPLTEVGRAEARALAGRLAGIRVDRIIASPMARALETARIVAAGRPVEVDERLRELRYGAWEGLTHALIESRDPALWARWDADPAATDPPGGECGNDVADRARDFLADLLAAESGAANPAAGRRSPDPGGSRGAVSESRAAAEGERRVLVVSHGTYNRILMCVAMAEPVRDYRRRFIQDRANLTVLRYEDGDGPEGAQLVLANDVAHLRQPGEAPWG